MAAHRKPLSITAQRLAALLELDPSTEHGWRWRHRHPSEFDGDERMCAVWNTKYAGRPAGSRQTGNGRPVIGVDGKFYDPRRLIAELGEAVAAIASQSEGLPHDGAANGNGVGSGVLASVIRDASRSTGLSRDDLTVMSAGRDPYRFDTPKRHREGDWFAGWFNQLLASTAIVHLRGLHYLLISHGGVLKPNGTPYENTDKDFFWLIDEAAKAARWLGYVDFDRIKDERNAAPVIFRSYVPVTPRAHVSASILGRGDWSRELGEQIEIVDCKPWAMLSGFAAKQPYCFAFFGEKSSLDGVLRPLARQFGINMYLCAGEISDTLIYEMAKDAAADGRPLIVFTFSDFDPAGRQMAVSIGRKLQALRDLKFPGLRAQVVPVSLTLEQVLAERLPTTPVKEGDKRRDRWDEAFGPALRAAGLVDDAKPAQVEIDALAAIRPDVLRRLTLEKVALYRDATLERRTGAVNSAWTIAALEVVNAKVDDERLAEIKQEAENAADDFNTALASLAEAQQRLRRADDDLRDLCVEIEAPKPPELPEPIVDLAAHKPLIDLDWSFADVTTALKAHKAYGGEGEDDE